METIVTNVAGKARREKRGGRDYLVVPLTSIVPGVLEGSKGKLLYPSDELAKEPSIWDGMPIVVDHPTVNGSPVSARDPDVIEKFGIGSIYRSRFEGKLQHEGWICLDDANRVDNSIVETLEAGRAMELSTGLFTQNEAAPEGATFNGRAYQFIARGYRPDHLAILPGDKIGACSVADGCGVLVNSDEKRTLWQRLGDLLGIGGRAEPVPVIVVTPVVNEMSHEQLRDALQRELKSRFTQADPYCYVCEVYGDYFVYEQGMKSYKLTYSQTETGVTVSGDPVEVIRQVEYVPTGEATMNRTQLIDFLVANCECWKGTNDRETLNKLSDEKLAALKVGAEKAKAAELVANAATKPVALPDGGTATWNAEKAAWEVKPKAVPEVPVATPVARPQSDAEWLSTAPPGVQSAVRNAMAFEQEQKGNLVAQLTANASEEDRTRLSPWLMQKPLDDLKNLVAILPRPVPGTQAPAPSYYGAGAPAPVGNQAKDDSDNLLPVITVNFDEMASPKLRRKQA